MCVCVCVCVCVCECEEGGGGGGGGESKSCSEIGLSDHSFNAFTRQVHLDMMITLAERQTR